MISFGRDGDSIQRGFSRLYVACIEVIHYLQESMGQPGEVVNNARGQLNRKNEHFPRSRLIIW